MNKWATALALSGCLGCVPSLVTTGELSSPVSALPPAVLPSGELAAAGESQWRKEVDAGPLEFDEAGSPVAPAHPVVKRRPFGVRLGPVAGVEAPENASINWVDSEGPTAGLALALGTGRFAFELGADVVKLKGQYYPVGDFKSDVLTGRVDLLVHFSGPESNVRLYLGGGVRAIQEQVKVDAGGSTLDSTTNAQGFGLSAGMRVGRFDFRFERVEAENLSRLVLNTLTAAIRF